MVHPVKERQGREEYLDYLDAWHQDRLFWLDNIRKTVSFANAGGAVASAAFIGTVEASGTATWHPKLAFFFFVVGYLIPILASFGQLSEAESQIKDIKSQKRDFIYPGIAQQKGIEKPPTRAQMKHSKRLSWTALGFLIAGLICAFWAIT